MGKSKLGIAVAGLGAYGAGMIIPALQETTLCRLSGLISGSNDKLNSISQKYNIPKRNLYSYDNFEDIANNEDIDIVYIALPNALHAEFTIKAAQAGKHVICEKPMALTEKQCEKMIQACEIAGVRLMIGYRLHFEPVNREAMRAGQEHRYGLIKHINADFGFNVGSPDQWRLKKELAGGGALMDVGIYCIQAARYVSGKEPISVRTTSYNIGDGKFAEVEESISWEMKFPGGIKASCSASYSKAVDRLRVEAQKGWMELGPAFEYSGQKGKTNDGPLSIQTVNQQVAELDAMADAIINNKEIRASGEEGLKDIRIIEAIYRSVKEKKEIRITEKFHVET